MVGHCLLMSLMSFCRPVQNSLNNLGVACLCPLCSSVGSVQNPLKKLGIVSLCPLCSSVKNRLYMRNRGGEKENAGSELVPTRVNEGVCVEFEAS